MCGGPSQTQLDLQSEEAQFYKTQIDAYNTAYANFKSIQDTLNEQFAPVLAAGPNQKGFSTEEENDLLSKAKTGTAVNFTHATQAARANVAARGGGNDTTNITSGGAEQLDEEIANTAAATESAEELGVEQADYAAGRSNFDRATAAEENLAQGWNPNTFAGSVDSSAKVANDEANEITKEQQSVWGSVLGGLSGVAGQWASAGFAVPK